MTKIFASLVISIGLLGARAFAGDTGPKTGAVQGIVFATDADGGRSVVGDPAESAWSSALRCAEPISGMGRHKGTVEVDHCTRVGHALRLPILDRK